MLLQFVCLQKVFDINFSLQVQLRGKGKVGKVRDRNRVKKKETMEVYGCVNERLFNF